MTCQGLTNYVNKVANGPGVGREAETEKTETKQEYKADVSKGSLKRVCPGEVCDCEGIPIRIHQINVSNQAKRSMTFSIENRNVKSLL